MSYRFEKILFVLNRLSLQKFVFSLVLTMAIGVHLTYAQGGELLKQQYRKGRIRTPYQKLNFEVTALASYVNGTSGNTSPTFGYLVSAKAQWRVSQTIAFSSGVGYARVGYQYNFSESEKYKDKISYLSVPLTLRLFPHKKFLLEIGAQYNFVLWANQITSENTLRVYEKGIFQNSFGLLVGIQYNFWNRFNASVQYRFSKRFSNPYAFQTNNLEGIYSGISFYLFKPTPR